MHAPARLAALLTVLAGCAGPAVVPDASVDDARTPDAIAPDAPSPVAATRVLAPCRAVLASADDLASTPAVLRHINALPPPATVACFVASLPRPLRIAATTSLMSAQPAEPGSPRVFLLLPGLTLSVVAEGMGAPLLEFGERVDVQRSVKGEVVLPPSAPFAPGDAYARVRYMTSGTGCGFCHRQEDTAPNALGGYSSLAYRPTADSLVDVAQLRALAATACESDDDVSDRCVFWHALLDGDLVQGEFDPRYATFAP